MHKYINELNREILNTLYCVVKYVKYVGHFVI